MLLKSGWLQSGQGGWVSSSKQLERLESGVGQQSVLGGPGNGWSLERIESRVEWMGSEVGGTWSRRSLERMESGMD